MWEKEIHYAIKAAVKAGKVIAAYYHKNISVREKAPDQPVTEADLAANSVIKKILSKKFPDDGWLSEEDVAEAERLQKDRVWIIDPLDGTKEFIRHNPEFAVSIALIHNREPVIGVIYNPVTKELFTAIKGQGAFFQHRPINVKVYENQEKPTLLVSISEQQRGDWNEYTNDFLLTPCGGAAWKMANIARGRADGSFTLSPKNEWDICAGHLLVEEAGGCVGRVDGSVITYNNALPHVPGLLYCNTDAVRDKILKVISQIAT